MVGSGLFGAVFANNAHKNGYTCLVIEKRAHIGGNIYTETVDGIDIHRYGAHIFHTNEKEVWSYVSQFATFRTFINSPIANYHGEIYNLPFNMNTFNKLWGVVTPAQAQKKLDEQRGIYWTEHPENLEQQALNLVGPELYEKLIKGYTEKQWGCPCRELPTFIIKRLPVRLTYDNRYFSDTFQGIPEGGYTKMIQNMLMDIPVVTSADYLKNRGYWASLADCIVYTGPIDEFFGYSFGKLPYRSLRFETEKIECSNFQGNAVVNYTDRESGYTRIIEHKHFYNVDVPYTIISKEYSIPCTLGMEPFYPITNTENIRLYERYKHHAASCCPNVLFGGRLGGYRYYNMDQIVKEAMCVSTHGVLEKLLASIRCGKQQLV